MKDTIQDLNDYMINIFNIIPNCMISLLVRLGIAGIFWRSAMTKITLIDEVNNFSLSQIWSVITLKWEVGDLTYILFENEYDLPFLSPEIAAHLAIAAEIIFPLLLVIGVGVRYASVGLLVMVIVIQFLVLPHAWPDHFVWAAALIYLIKNGAGKLSVDHLLSN